MAPVTTLLWYVAPMCASGAIASTRAASLGLVVQGVEKDRHNVRPLGLGSSTG